MDRQQVTPGDAELPPTAPPPTGRLDHFREHHRQAFERHRHTVSYRVPIEMQQAQMLQQRYLQPGGGAQKGPPTTAGRGGAADKSQGVGGVELETSEHGRPAEEGMVAKGAEIPKEVEDVIRQVQTQAQAQAMPPSSRAKAPPLPSGGTAGCTPVGTDGTKPAVPVDPTHTLPVVSSTHSSSPSPGSVPGGAGNGRSRPQQPAAQLAYQRAGGTKGGSTPSSQDDELNLDANEFLNKKFNLLKSDGTTPNATPPPSTTAIPQSSPGTKMAAAGPKPAVVAAIPDAPSAQPKQPGYAHCPLGTAPPTSTYTGPAPSLYPSDHHPPPPHAPTDVAHGQSGYDELSEADMMWNKYANPKQQQQPAATLTSQPGHAHQHPSPMTGQVYMPPAADALSHTGYPPPHQHANSGSTQTPTGGPGNIPGGHEAHPQGVVTSPTSYPTQQYHAPAPSAGMNPHPQQYYMHEVRRQQGTVPMANLQPQQTMQMYQQQRRVVEGHPAHQQYLAATHQQQHVAAVAASQYQRDQIVAAQRQGWDPQWAQQHPQQHSQHPQQLPQQHTQQQLQQQQQENQRMALFQQQMNLYSNPAQQGVGVPLPSSLHGVLKQGPPNVVMTQSAPLNYTQTTYTVQQQQPDRGYTAAQGHAPQMMAQPHEGVYQHHGMGQQVHQSLQSGGQHAYQTVDGRTHIIPADPQHQLYAQTQHSSYGGHFGAGSHPGAVLYPAGMKRGVPSGDLAAYEVATKQMMTHSQGMVQQAPVTRMVQQAPVARMVQQPVAMVQHASGMVQHAAGMTQQAQYYGPH